MKLFTKQLFEELKKDGKWNFDYKDSTSCFYFYKHYRGITFLIMFHSHKLDNTVIDASVLFRYPNEIFEVGQANIFSQYIGSTNYPRCNNTDEANELFRKFYQHCKTNEIDLF